MATRTVAHALARWTDPDGIAQLALHGQTIEIPKDVAAHLDSIGATVVTSTTVAPEPEPDPVVVISPTTDEPSREVDPDLFPRPKNAAARPLWELYAVDRGLDRASVSGMSKDAIIAAINELDAPHEQEHPHG